jgi:poly-gamma-glutamate synthesis protein (capsule biosynthesis protein)
MKHLTHILAIVVATALSVGAALYITHSTTTIVPVEALSEAPVITTDTIRLLFGGDFMQHMPQVNAARTPDGSYDYSRSTEYIAPMFREADVAVINLETTISTTGHYSGYPCFASPVEVVDEFETMGIDIALLANNHCCDRMARGIETTIEELNRRNIAHTGVYTDSVDYAQNNILYFERGGVRFALVNYTYGTNGIPVPKGKLVNLIDTTIIKRDLRTIDRDSVACVIACMHWGNEYERHENREQRRLAEVLQREGVDIIIGSHPHVVQPFYADSTNVLFYSLGNLVSNQQRHYTDGGLIAEVEVIRCDTIEGLRYRATAHPVWVLCPGYRILPRSVGDTLTMPKASRDLYERFMRETDELLYH